MYDKLSIVNLLWFICSATCSSTWTVCALCRRYFSLFVCLVVCLFVFVKKRNCWKSRLFLQREEEEEYINTYIRTHVEVENSLLDSSVCVCVCCGGKKFKFKQEERSRMKTFQAYLPSGGRTYSCVHCRAHLANHDELISKSFQGSQGKAYLFNSVVNVGCGPAEERVLLTGLHAVADIYCECCKTTLGWKYEHAFESSQKYKEGKYIIELAHMIKDNGWDSKR
ncbi:Protein yippee-like 2 [Trichinella pseudospiralis]|uniref:Protein yippee-like 2 n=2 Tax=Trichinella pseudospiralis TaxID=6337 RepID=A0A0V1KFY3_TRIPS|nr:Protein yippee-like 2 [Trichinella pseudospiralis]